MNVIRVQVYLDGLRDQTHHADGEYEEPLEAQTAAMNALKDLAVSEVRLVKVKK